MRRQDFSYDLPETLIAKQPMPNRTESRLLSLDGPTGRLEDRSFSDVLDYLQPGDLMVFNDTRVIPARLFGQKETGGKLEILIERVLDTSHVLAHVKSSKSPKPGSFIVLSDGTKVEVGERQNALFELNFKPKCVEGALDVLDVLAAIGHMPLPPYIDRPDEDSDQERYQTVYSKELGAVAAPTAGLHFDEDLLERIKAKGVSLVFVTLHVGAGTFQPVRVDDIYQHAMHSEVMTLNESVCEQVRATKASGGRVVAVGTTSVRCLETAAKSGEIAPYQGDTDIFIYPGYQFNVVDRLITNFHLPESTLIMLVSAFAGYKNTMAAYKQAVNAKYRFFSYGDAMFISLNPEAPKEQVV